MNAALSSFWREYAEDRQALAGLAGFGVICFAALFAPLLSPQDPYNLAQLSIVNGRLPPGSQGAEGEFFLLGTDEQGRDIYSAILYGLRTSLGVGVTSVFLAAFIGAFLGWVAAYMRGVFDIALMRAVDLQLSIPSILIALILLAVLGKGVDKVLIALVAAQWAIFARIARAAALSEMQKEYIAAAQGLAFGKVRIILKHLAPNSVAPLIVMATISVAAAISLEATLSFLGLGVPVTRPSLGLLISNGFEYLLSGRYWISVFPGLALVFAIISINLVGDRLTDILNPRLKR